MRDIDEGRRAVVVIREPDARLAYAADRRITYDEGSPNVAAAHASSVTLPRSLRSLELPDAGLRDASVLLVLDAGGTQFGAKLVSYDGDGLSVR